MTSPHPDPATFLERFGLLAFRPGQREVIETVLAGHDCLCIMPTGGGKSLCYQLPAVMRGGLTLVVSPLIALMKDQVDALQQLDLSATFINSSLTSQEQRERMKAMAAGTYTLVYIAPERLRNTLFLEAVRQTQVGLLVVDEAHCISEWGHDFRPDYARLGRFREKLGFPQTIALTATATPDVREDVQKLLKLRSPRVFITGFARPNLRFEVAQPRTDSNKQDRLLEFLQSCPGSGIIYVSTRKACAELADLLKPLAGRPVGQYHAGLLPEERRHVQDEFMAGRVAIMVATNAFGMGIDKRNLRFVVHYNIPGTLEAYYQEAGRAGRDGQPSRCLLLYNYADTRIQEFFIENSYPERTDVAMVYDFLRSQDEDPIEVTLEELRDRLGLSLGTEGIAACERLLEKCGAIERLDSQQNHASVRISSEMPTLVDLLPRDAKAQRRVLQSLEKFVGDQRDERVFFHLNELGRQCEMTRDAVNRALRELTRLAQVDYVPPFRGRAIHLLQRDLPFSALQIDFEELARRKQAEYEKLERMCDYATTRRCRQLQILNYFGDPQPQRCGTCDNCAPRLDVFVATTVPDAGVVQAVRIVLSGVARLNQRFGGRVQFGKKVLVQMLRGANTEQVKKWDLSQLTTYGLLKHLTQPELGHLVDEVLNAGLLTQSDVERNRPVLTLTERGDEVMRGRAEFTDRLALPAELLVKLQSSSNPAAPARRVSEEPATPARRVSEGSPTPSAPSARPIPIEPLHSPSFDTAPAESPTEPEAAPRPMNSTLQRTLRKWRGELADQFGISPSKVMPNALLDRIAAASPATIAELAAVPGVTSDVLALGDGGLAALVAKCVAETPLDASGRPSHYWTGRALAAGFSLRDCAALRRLDEETIAAEAIAALNDGASLRLQSVFPPDHQAALDRYDYDSHVARLLRRMEEDLAEPFVDEFP